MFSWKLLLLSIEGTSKRSVNVRSNVVIEKEERMKELIYSERK